jgi:hypothetical protein
MAQEDRRAALFFAGIVIFVVVAGAVAGTPGIPSLQFGGGLINTNVGLVCLLSTAAAWCAYRYGRLWAAP